MQGTTAGPPIRVALWQRYTPELLELLSAAAPQLRSLEHTYPFRQRGFDNTALPANLTRLTSLTLSFGRAAVHAAQIDGMVRTLPLLQHLELAIEGPSLPGGFPTGIATSCPLLTRLAIRGGARTPTPTGDLAAQPDTSPVPPELGLLTALTHLELTHAGFTSLPESVSRLSALRELALGSRSGRGLHSGLAACAQLSQLDVSGNPSASVSPVLARLRSLRRLSVWSEPRREAPWTQLTGLTQLQLQCGDETVGEVPPDVGAMTELRNLTLTNAFIDDLPAGPYLSRLENLSWRHCLLRVRLPASLAAAVQLRHLDIGNTEACVCMTAADVSLLSSLPLLATLRLAQLDRKTRKQLVGVLEAACIACGHAPPAVLID